MSAHQIEIASGELMFDLNIAVFYPTERLKRLLKCQAATLRFRIVRGECMQKKDTSHALGLLRTCHQRPRRRSAKSRDELAPFHAGLG